MALEQLEYDHTVHTVPKAGDETLLVRFFIDAWHDPVASKKENRPIYRDVEWIDIRIPGNRDNVVTRPARPGDRQRFPQHYAAFKQRIGTEQQEVGTPLSAWPWHGMTRARVEELKYFNVRTVEQLAALADSSGQQIMGFHAMKQAAGAYLEAQKSSAPIARLQVQLEQALQKIEEQGVEIARLTAESRGLPAPSPQAIEQPLRVQVRETLAEVLPGARRSHKRKR